MPFDILLVSVLRTFVEVAGFALLGQGALVVLAGKYREQNAFYRVLRIVTRPVVRAVRFITPRFIIAVLAVDRAGARQAPSVRPARTGVLSAFSLTHAPQSG
jgi:hypothetical protein